MAEEQDVSYKRALYRKPVIVDDDYLADIAKRLRMLRSLVKQDKTSLS